ncbi:MAG: glutamate--tRNA ligase [Verrucomicrobiota bacterium]
MDKKNVRTRFAPSPTGLLHIGGARTALFNWLYARHFKGQFILRIEDTDASRNTPEANAVIFRGLEWLGLHWDEGPVAESMEKSMGNRGPYRQSLRSSIYEKYIQKLIDAGHAYEDNKAIRFKLPKEKITVNDLICGERTFDLSEQPDITIRRPDGSPIFHLVNVVDDLEMGITHVLRGEDHLQNTPKHLALFQALEAEPPSYGHIPLILNPNGSKMSKRDEGSSIDDYMRPEFIPEAIVNYLCLLGWSPKDDSEKMPLQEIIRRFDLPQINRSNARIDLQKMHWLNGEYWKDLENEAYYSLAQKVLRTSNIDLTENEAYLHKILDLIQDRIKTGFDLAAQVKIFYDDAFAYEEKASKKVLKKEDAPQRLQHLIEAFEHFTEDSFTADKLEETLQKTAEAHNQKPGAYMPLCRFGISGQNGGPSLYHMMEIMGKNRILTRLSRTLEKINSGKL